MIAAVATCGDGQVAPALDFAPEVRIFEAGPDGRARQVDTLEGFGAGRESLLAGALGERGLDCVVCGGISRPMLWMLAEAGVQVYPGASGSAVQALSELAAGSLSPMTPRAWRRRGRRRGRGRGGGGRGGRRNGRGFGR
jgi:predicted Fe-Mo cluster-binding NifX family protein